MLEYVLETMILYCYTKNEKELVSRLFCKKNTHVQNKKQNFKYRTRNWNTYYGNKNKLFIFFVEELKFFVLLKIIVYAYMCLVGRKIIAARDNTSEMNE